MQKPPDWKSNPAGLMATPERAIVPAVFLFSNFR
jgi:hypothetical protein